MVLLAKESLSNHLITKVFLLSLALPILRLIVFGSFFLGGKWAAEMKINHPVPLIEPSQDGRRDDGGRLYDQPPRIFPYTTPHRDFLTASIAKVNLSKYPTITLNSRFPTINFRLYPFAAHSFFEHLY